MKLKKIIKFKIKFINIKIKKINLNYIQYKKSYNKNK